MDEQLEEEEMRTEVINMVANLGAEAVIEALAAACRIAAEVDKENNDWPSAGTHNHYAQTLEELIGQE